MPKIVYRISPLCGGIFLWTTLNLIVYFGTLLIGVEGTKIPAGGRGRGDPAGAQRRGGFPDRPRTARAWSGNQQACYQSFLMKNEESYFIKKNLNLLFRFLS
ncbi:hypothetical protein [Bacillus sp. X1(2014)]|uniref:hypothetical protein n=1 Tax=Bacillus sp. X1(2014) TaxID=1565991 RepID=UPI0011A8AC7E|nr:hypothetical protein [Bacillus sp. X1(2014)]